MNTHTRSMHYDDHDIIMIMFIIICLVVIIIIALELCGNCVCVCFQIDRLPSLNPWNVGTCRCTSS